jgi:hypothetical protein
MVLLVYCILAYFFSATLVQKDIFSFRGALPIHVLGLGSVNLAKEASKLLIIWCPTRRSYIGWGAVRLGSTRNRERLAVKAPQPNAPKSRADGAVKFEQAKSCFGLYNI